MSYIFAVSERIEHLVYGLFDRKFALSGNFIKICGHISGKSIIHNTNSSSPRFTVEELLWFRWIRPRTLNREIPGSNLLAAAASRSSFGQGTLSSLPSPSERT